VEADVDTKLARAALASRRPLRLLLPPISKQQRLSAIGGSAVALSAKK